MSEPELEKMDKETREVMNNPDTMEQIRQSGKDIREGRVKTITSVQDMLDELDETG